MRFVLIISVFFLVFSQGLLAQLCIENRSLDTIRIDMKLKKSAEFQQIAINSALQAIAYTHQKPTETLCINWELITSYQVFKQENGNFISEVLIKPLPPKGDIYLYNFNSATYILPQLQSFRLSIYKEDNTLVYVKFFNENPVSVSSAGKSSHFQINHQRWAEGWHIEIDQFEFQYNMSDYYFEQWFQYTNDYKAANFLVDELSKNYRKLQESSQEPSQFLMKSFLQDSYLKNLYQMPFYLATVGKKNDPDKLEKKMKILSTLIDLNIDKYIPLVRESDSKETITVEPLVDVYLNEEESLLKLKQKFGSIYDDLFLQLAKTKYPSNLTYKDVALFDLIETNVALRKKKKTSFENSLYKQSVSHIDQLVQNLQFSEALFSIDNLESFIGYVDAFEANVALKQFKVRAAYGIYYSYINVVEKAIDARNYKLAAQYLKKAGLVQETYSQQIITNSLADKKLRLLLDIWYDDYNQMIAQNMYIEAAAKRDTIRDLIVEFKLEDVQAMLSKLNNFDDQLLLK